MSASASRPLHRLERFGHLWWLPSHGQGNGLSDGGWAPIADVDGLIVLRLLADLRAVGAPAYAARIAERPSRRRSSGESAAQSRWRLWVGTKAYSRAEEVLRVRLPVLLSEAHRTQRADVPENPGGRT